MRYIALLRGVNVGGKNKVPMEELRSVFEKEGFCQVKTYINSGNVLFDSEVADKGKLQHRCQEAIEEAFGLQIPVAVFLASELIEAVRNAPDWWRCDPQSSHNAIFVIPPFTAEEVMAQVGGAKPEYEKIAHHKNLIFWSAPVKTQSRTRWSKIVGTEAYAKVTIRNANTAAKLAAMAGEELMMNEKKELRDMSLEELWQLFPIIIKEHSPDYADWYQEEQDSLCRILEDHDVTRVNHIGSTSVPGLKAKPIVDMLLELPEGYDRDEVADLLKRQGWTLMAGDDEKQTLDFNKGYTPAGFADKVFHLHIKPSGDWDELYFRDYLRQSSDAAREYERLKLALKEQFEHNRDSYTDAKSDFVMTHTKKAREEFGGRYMPVKL